MEAKTRLPAFAYWALVFLVILLFALIRFRLREMPLERDEGEYAYAGQLLLKGVPPYLLAYNMKLPGTYAAYALGMAVFGETSAGIHLTLMMVSAATTFLVVLLARRLFGQAAGLAAGASYALLSTSTSVLGLAGHATQFVVLPAVAGTLLLLHAVDSRSRWLIWAAGFLLGSAFVMKQPGFAFVLFGVAYLIGIRRKLVIGELAPFLCGAAAPFLLTCGLLLKAGVFDRFWFWTFSYGGQYGSIVSPIYGLGMLIRMIPYAIAPSMLIWAIAAIGFSAVAWDERVRGKAFFLLSFTLFSFLGVSAGFYFRSHYFVLMLPAVAILAGAAATATRFKTLLGGLLVASLALTLFWQRDYFFRMSPLEATRNLYGSNPFPEAIELGQYLHDHTGEQSRIAVLGSEPEIYFYAGRRSATGYIYTYGLMEPQRFAGRMQDEMIQEIESGRPEYMVYVHSPESWLRSRNSDARIFAWSGQFLKSEYDLVAYGGSDKFSVYRRKSSTGVPESKYRDSLQSSR
jgi:4-amino-4-deoxy-L-arabinose transferase-like glycosyltransferase